MRRVGVAVLLVGGLALLALCLLIPALVAARESLLQGVWADAGLTPRRWGLLLRGVLVAAVAALLAQLLGAALAAGLTRRAGVVRAASALASITVLLTPPYIYAYAWSLPLLPYSLPAGSLRGPVAPEWLASSARAVWCLATWSCPLAAAILACGWRVNGRPAYWLTALDAGMSRSLRRGALPAMRPWIGLSLATVGLLALTEYSICHLCLVQTWNTEVLAEVQANPVSGHALLLAWPLLVPISALAIVLGLMRTRLSRLLEELALLPATSVEGSRGSRRGDCSASAAAWIAIALLAVPALILGSYLRSPAALWTTWRTSPSDWPDGLLCAAGAALASLWLALAIDFVLAAPVRPNASWRIARAAGWGGLFLWVFAAIGPPVLVGDAFAAAYARVPLIADHWVVVSLLLAARYGAIAVVLARAAGSVLAEDTEKVAAADGADWTMTFWRVRIAAARPVLLIAALVVGVLSFTEVAATQLVRPPGVGNLAITLLNAIHFGRNDEVVAMCLYVILLVIAVAGGLLLLRRWSRRHAAQA